MSDYRLHTSSDVWDKGVYRALQNMPRRDEVLTKLVASETIGLIY